MRLPSLTALCLALMPLATTAVSGEVVISEIMYNPASAEGNVREKIPNQTEWVEIYNAGDEAVSLSGWYLSDEDGKTKPLPDSAVIQPGEAVVLIPGVQSVGDFRAAWGKGFQVFKLDGWAVGDDPMKNLGNSPSEKNEVLTLRDSSGEVMDEVNYDDADGWPAYKEDGWSIALKPDALDAKKNDEGKNWVRSEAGKLGAKNAKATEEYKAEDVGSPGKVVTQDDE